MRQVKGYSKEDYIDTFGKTAVTFGSVDEAADAWEKVLDHLTREQIIEGFYNGTNGDAVVMDDGTIVMYESPEHYQKRKDAEATPIRKARRKTTLSMKEAAQLIGVPLRTWENWELGYRTPPDYVEKLIVEKILTFKKKEYKTRGNKK